MFALMITLLGCSTKQPEVPAKPLQQALMFRCPVDLPELPDGTGRSVLEALSVWSAQYHRCSIRHNGLVDTLEDR